MPQGLPLLESLRGGVEGSFPPALEPPAPQFDGANAHLPRLHKSLPQDTAGIIDAQLYDPLVPGPLVERSVILQDAAAILAQGDRRLGCVIPWRSAEDRLHLRQAHPDLDPVERRP